MKRSYFKLITIILCLVIACAIIFSISFKWFSPPAQEQEETLQTDDACTIEDNDEATAEDEGPYDETVIITDGDTLAEILGRMEIPPSQIQDAITALSKVFDPKDLKIDQEINVLYTDQIDEEGYDLKSLYLQPDIDYDIELIRNPSGLFEATKHKKLLKHDYVDIHGNIDMSLYADALKAGASPKMLSDMIKAFSYDVDFQRDIQPGTEFSLFYDTHRDEESGLERPGILLYARLVLENKPYELYHFQPPGGIPGYYTAQGDAVKKALLRTPIDGARLSSGFGKRKHPILGFTKMHKGVDFAAPKGTPIMAAGDGVVECCKRFGGYGNYICIRHNGNTKTAYAHLSRYAKGMKAGRKVRQGQIIGHVGCTGHATGPHLHFELILNGKQVNPQTMTQMPASKLSGKALAEFKASISKIDKMRKEREKKQTSAGL